MPTKLTAARGYFDSGDGLRLYAEHDPVADARARLIFVHGYAEHCGRYRAMAELLIGHGYACHRFDLRGHGRSEGRPGHVYAFADYLRDVRAFRARCDADHPASAPTYLVAHSMGGLVALYVALEEPDGLAGMALSSPYCGIAMKVPAWKALAGKALSRYLPAFSMPTDIPPDRVSRDPATIAEYGTDPLIGRVATARWFTETSAAQEALPPLAERITLPVLVQQAGADQITSPPAARAVFERIGSPDKTWIDYPGLYHELWFEPERETVYADLLDWLGTRTAAR